MPRRRRKDESDKDTAKIIYKRKRPNSNSASGEQGSSFKKEGSGEVFPVLNEPASPAQNTGRRRGYSLRPTSTQQATRSSGKPGLPSIRSENTNLQSWSTAAKSRDFENQEIFARPMCLIDLTKDRGFSIEEKVLHQIQKIDVPLVVVAIVGEHRSGKSYLMNRLAGVSKGFPLGHTIKPETKGIWAWCQKHPKFSDTVLLLLDTEGLGDAKGDRGHDNRIFTLASLLCNVLVCNVMTAVNQDVFEQLTFISELSKNVRFSNKSDIPEENDQLELILPTFVLCIRDFTLALEDGGRKLTADEYLEKCLKLKQGRSPDIEQYNRPRESVRKYFLTRKCFTFDAPGTRDTLQRIEKLRLEQLSKNFVEETKMFLAYIYKRNPKVLLTSKPVTGLMFVPLVETYVRAIREGAVLDVDDAIMAVAIVENERLAKKAVEIFKEIRLKVKLPVFETDKLDKRRQDLQTKCLAQLLRESVLDKDGKYEKIARDEMDRFWEELKAENHKQLEAHCETVLNRLHACVAKKKKDGVYFTKGGFKEYKTDIATTKTIYKHRVEKIDEALAMEVLHRWIENEEKDEIEILISDEQYSDEERKREMETIKRERLKAQQDLQNQFERRIKEEAERAEEHVQKLEKQRMENNRQHEHKLKQLTDQSAKHRQKIKQLKAKYVKEQGAHKSEPVAMQDSIRKQNDEFERRLQQERQIDNARKEMLKEQSRERGGVLTKKEKPGPGESKSLTDVSIADEDRKYDHNEPMCLTGWSFVLTKTEKQGPGESKSHTDFSITDESRNYDQNEPRRLTEWTIDPSAWDQCIMTQDENICKDNSKTLLEELKLPNCELLNKVCKRFGRKSDTISAICSAICDYLKQKYNCIVGVWPGYRFTSDDKSENRDVVFAALTNSYRVIQDENFDLICRVVDQTTTEKENKAIMERERKEPPNVDDLQKLKQVQRKCAPRLMDEHKRLVRVTVSWIKHTTGKTSDSALRKCLCIALYVQIRGLVPLNEEPFPKQIDDYPVDVREGLVLLCGGPTDYHNPLKMGCRISAQHYGTLGPFVMFENRPLDQYALSSAHVLLESSYLKTVFEKGITINTGKTEVFQPEKCPEDYFGDVVKAVHKRGDEQTAGMEIGLIQVHKRQPDSGNFAGLEQDKTAFGAFGKPFVYTSGEVMDPSSLKRLSDVYKYGSETGLKVGKLRIDGPSFRTFTVNGVSEQMVLHGQIEVDSSDDFALPSDSGALLMIKSETSDNLVAVGIFEGEASDKTCFFATPLAPVLKELGSDCYLNKYTQDTVPEDSRMDVNGADSLSVENKVAGLENKVDILRKEMDKGFQKCNENIESLADIIKTSLASGQSQK